MAIVRATLAGTAVALGVPAFIFLIALFKTYNEPVSLRITIGAGLLALAVMLILIGCSVVLIGIPISLCLRKAGRENLGSYALLGALSGFVVTLIWWLISSHPDTHDFTVDLALIAFIGVFGAASGTVTGMVLCRSLRR